MLKTTKEKKSKHGVKLGLVCEHCGTTLSDVAETRAADGHIRRVRVCFNGHRFTTRETAVRMLPVRDKERGEKITKLLALRESQPKEQRQTYASLAIQLGVTVQTLFKYRRALKGQKETQ